MLWNLLTLWSQLEIIEQTQMSNQNINKKAIAVSIGAHLLLLVICLFIGYSLPASSLPIEEMGMEVNLGSSDNGSGTDQPMNTDHPAFQPTEQASKATNTQASTTTQNLATDENDADAPTINNEPKPRKNNESKKDNRNTALQQQKPKILFPASNGKGGNAAANNKDGSNEGDGSGQGDKGVSGGTPGAANYSGIPGGGGVGIGHSFSDRTIVSKPRPDAEFKEGGKVVIHITVNREGNIVSKRVKSSPSNELSKLAIEKLKDVRFNSSSNVPPEQFGDITFVFKTRASK